MTIKTPCVGMCSTTYGDEVCRGCKRFYHEIIDWNSFGDTRKLAILSRLEQVMNEEVSTYLIVVDEAKLQSHCERLTLKYRPDFTSPCWAHALLSARASTIKNLEDYGLSVKADFKHLTLLQLFERIDDAIYTQARALYLEGKG